MKKLFFLTILLFSCLLVSIITLQIIQSNSGDWLYEFLRERFSITLPALEPNRSSVEGVQGTKLQYQVKELGSSTTLFLIPRANSFQLDYLENAGRKELSKFQSFDLVFNSGYFTPDLRHAGLLISDGAQKVALAPNDLQLNGVVRFTIDRGVEIIYNPNFKSDDGAVFEFQTGPIFIQDNIIADEFINKSLNGRTRHMRTFMGYSDEYSLIIGISTEPVSLYDLSEIILKSARFTRLNLINLDGGSSTAIYIRDQNNKSFRSFKQLPFLIGVKFE